MEKKRKKSKGRNEKDRRGKEKRRKGKEGQRKKEKEKERKGKNEERKKNRSKVRKIGVTFIPGDPSCWDRARGLLQGHLLKVTVFCLGSIDSECVHTFAAHTAAGSCLCTCRAKGCVWGRR